MDLVHALEGRAMHDCVRRRRVFPLLKRVPIAIRGGSKELERASRAADDALPLSQDCVGLVVRDVAGNRQRHGAGDLFRGDAQKPAAVFHGVVVQRGDSDVDGGQRVRRLEGGLRHDLNCAGSERDARCCRPLQVDPEEVDAGCVGRAGRVDGGAKRIQNKWGLVPRVSSIARDGQGLSGLDVAEDVVILNRVPGSGELLYKGQVDVVPLARTQLDRHQFGDKRRCHCGACFQLCC